MCFSQSDPRLLMLQCSWEVVEESLAWFQHLQFLQTQSAYESAIK